MMLTCNIMYFLIKTSYKSKKCQFTGAEKHGGKCSELLFDDRGSMSHGTTNRKGLKHEEVTPEMIEKTTNDLKIIESKKKRLQKSQALEKINLL